MSASETANGPAQLAIPGDMITRLLHSLCRAGAPCSLQSLPDKTCLTVQFVNLSTALKTCFAPPAWARSPTPAGPSRLRFPVLTVNFTFHNQPLPITQGALVKSESRVQIVNFTIDGALRSAARVRSSRPQFGVQTANPSTSLRTCLSTTLETYLARKTNISRLPQLPLPRVQFVNFAPLASAVTDPVAVARQVSLKDRL